jgi:GNAT superfamily N-acetyltransferase
MPEGSPISIRAARSGDAGVLLSMFRELAEYEQLTHVLQASEERIESSLLGASPTAQALIAERGAEPAGYAVFFTTFSSFLARPGIWLEDIFVRPPHRRLGIGRALLAAVAARAVAIGGARLEWAALDWNELALGFYRDLGAHTMSEWITHRLDGEALARMAHEGHGRSGESR